MSHVIRLLPDTIANQIAAGEVVQRPASIVKELMENAIDAGSTTVKVVIKDAGKKLVQVIDNGSGMSEVDARMCFEKHATSKIKTSEDLFNIHTMGFRGEALASIAAVAQLEMETCAQEGNLGTRVVIEGSAVKSQTPVSAPKGTKISVKNLFYNVPARRNFLKSNPVETKHIIDEFQRVALARPEIAFSLYQNDLETYQLPAGKLSHRIVHLLGSAYKQQLIPCQEATDTLKIHGYIGQPNHAKKTRGDQFFFVNQRFIKSAYLNHAIKSAFEGLLPKDTFPFYAIFIDIAPERIDVNVHPTKTEIKFEDERMIYSMLAAVVKQALAKHHMMPSIDFEQNVNFNPFAVPAAASPLGFDTPASLSTQDGGAAASPTPASPPKSSENHYTQFRRPSHTQPGGTKDWERLAQHLERSADIPPSGPAESTSTSATTTTDADTPTDAVTAPSVEATTPAEAPTERTAKPAAPSPALTEGVLKVQLHGQYILTQVKHGIVLVDQCAAHERILYERYIRPLQDEKSRGTQSLLFPVHVSLNLADLALVQEHMSALQQLGFVLEPFGKDSLVVTGCPVEAVDHDPKQLLEGLVEQLKWNQTQLSLHTHERVARALAKRACMPAGKRLQKEEIDTLLDQLFACENPNYTPGGGKTFVVMELKDIEKAFLR